MRKKLNKIQLLALAFILVFLSGFGLRCTPEAVKQNFQPVRLTYWRVWDGPDAFAEIINAYRAIHPNVTIEYKKFRYEEYEDELINAFAEDRGPDIFAIHNTWMQKYQNKIEPMPPQITMVYPTVKGKIKKEVYFELKTTNSLTARQLQDSYVDVVYDDVVLNYKNPQTGALQKRIFGLPLSVDTMVMFYNRDLLNNAGIPHPPQYWNQEFIQNVKQLSKQDSKGQIIQSGVALGGSTNIERYSDILSVLMMQNGTVMMQNGVVQFNVVPNALISQGYNPGFEALRFYSDFANPAKEVYSWNASLDNSLDMFIQGKLAMLFGYSYHIPTIQARAKKLNYSIAPLPQIEGNLQQINFANYWVETVAKKSPNSAVAWDFLQFAAREDIVRAYLNTTKRPTALRSLIKEQTNDTELEPFANQLLTAESWYRGNDANAMEIIMGEMIDQAIADPTKLQDVLNFAAKRVQQTIE
jgi:ABC-type glycerol-3-phosphate transport system substrate-binding protein